MSTEKEWYNNIYTKRNYFGYSERLYKPFISAIVRKSKLEHNSTVLDVGCGQGFFTNLLANNGLNATGIDISETGIAEARELSDNKNVRFEVGDIMDSTFEKENEFDCVLTRALSLYNSKNFADDTSVTDRLLQLVKPGGVLIFIYNSNLDSSRTDSPWRHHNYYEATQHFSHYTNKQIYFSTKVDTYLFGRFGLNPLFSMINVILCKNLSFGGEILGFVHK